MNNELLSKILDGEKGENQTEYRKKRYTILMQEYSFLIKGKIYRDLDALIRQKRQLSPKQRVFVKQVVKQWDSKNIRRFCNTMRQYPFLQGSVVIYNKLIGGGILDEKDMRLIERFTEAYKANKRIFREYFKKHDNAEINLAIYDILVENKWLGDKILYALLPKIKVEWVKDQLLYRRAVYQAFSRLRKPDSFTQQLKALLKRQVPLTMKQFGCIERMVGDVKVDKAKSVKYGSSIHNRAITRQI